MANVTIRDTADAKCYEISDLALHVLGFFYSPDPVYYLLGVRDISEATSGTFPGGFSPQSTRGDGIDYQASTHFRQKNFHKRRNALFRLAFKTSKECKAAICVIAVPESLNAAVYSSHGTFNEFMRAFAAAVRGIRSRKSATLKVSVSDTWLRFARSSSTNGTKPFDALFAGLSTHVDPELLQCARKTLDDEICFAPSSDPLTASNSRLTQLLSDALRSYVASASASVAD